jgi:hypothetical protein
MLSLVTHIKQSEALNAETFRASQYRKLMRELTTPKAIYTLAELKSNSIGVYHGKLSISR